MQKLATKSDASGHCLVGAVAVLHQRAGRSQPIRFARRDCERWRRVRTRTNGPGRVGRGGWHGGFVKGGGGGCLALTSREEFLRWADAFGTGAALHQRVGRNQPRLFAGRDRQGGGGCTGCELALLGREVQPMTGGDGCGPYQRAGKKVARAFCTVGSLGDSKCTVRSGAVRDDGCGLPQKRQPEQFAQRVGKSCGGCSFAPISREGQPRRVPSKDRLGRAAGRTVGSLGDRTRPEVHGSI